jgi:uncharacterized lipoprotein YddW (UPF0748 family)
MKHPLILILAALFACPLLAPAPAVASPLGDRTLLLKRLSQDHGALLALQGRFDAAKLAYVDAPLDSASVSLSLAKMSLDTAQLLVSDPLPSTTASHWLDKAEAYLKEGGLRLLPSRNVEARGMLMDASAIPKTEAGIVELVKKLQGANFNLLLPEINRRGYTLDKSRLTAQDPEFVHGPDVLSLLIREAHKRGMEVQPWLWTFRVRSLGYGNPVLSRHPELASSENGKDSRFLSPAEPAARAYVYKLVKEIKRRYPVDGLLLDYIRYDERIPEDDISKALFSDAYAQRYGKLPPATIPPHTEMAVQWQLWRESQVSQTVEDLAHQLHSHQDDFPISAAVFRSEKIARLDKMQNWRHWSNNHWISWASPMLYTDTPSDLKTWLDWETDKHQRTNLLYPILGAQRFKSPDDIIPELNYLNTANVAGALVFSLGHFDLSCLDDLAEGPYRQPASLPNRSLIHATRKALMGTCSYLATVFERSDFETAATSRVLRDQILDLARTLPLDELPYRENYALIERLKGIQALANDLPCPTALRLELAHQLDYAVSLVAANQFDLNRGHFVPSTLPPIEVSRMPRRDAHR